MLQENASRSKAMVVSRNEGYGVNVQFSENMLIFGCRKNELRKLVNYSRVRKRDKIRVKKRNKRMSVETMKSLYEAIAVPVFLFEIEDWMMNARSMYSA